MGVYLPYTRLPSAYQEVEYIQSSGTQFIDTGYLITPTTEVSVDYQFTNTSDQDFAFGVGSDTNTSSGMTFCVYIGLTNRVPYFKAGLSDGAGSSTWSNSGPSPDTNRHRFVLNNGHFLTYNSSGTLQKDVTTVATFTRTATHSFGLFCWWRLDTSAWANKTSAKLYGCKVKDNGILQRDFVPCYRKSDSVIGLYDLVNNQFYTNSGTGTFTKGADVTAMPLKNAYIGEYHEYSYTFQGKTIDQVYADGWTKVGSQTPSIDSVGLLTSGADLFHKLPFTFVNSNKIEMEMGCKLGNSGSVDLVMGISSSGGGRTNISHVYNSYNSYNNLSIGATSKGSFTHSSNGIVTYTWVLDLEGKIATLTYSDGTTANPSSWSITDSEIANIRTNEYVFVYSSGTPRVISATVKSY